MNIKIFSANFDRNNDKCRQGITEYLKDLTCVGF